jgi:ADP-ribosylation factor-like protein 3
MEMGLEARVRVLWTCRMTAARRMSEKTTVNSEFDQNGEPRPCWCRQMLQPSGFYGTRCGAADQPFIEIDHGSMIRYLRVITKCAWAFIAHMSQVMKASLSFIMQIGIPLPTYLTLHALPLRVRAIPRTPIPRSIPHAEEHARSLLPLYALRPKTFSANSNRTFENWMGGGSSKTKRRLLFLGLDNAGKTTILKALGQENPTNIAPTRGFNVKQIAKGNVEFTIWDIGGQKALRAYWSGYFDKTNGIVWVIDSSDTRRLEETGVELAALLQEEKLAGGPLLILANKQDLATAVQPDQITIDLGLHEIRNRNWQIQGCSALSKAGLEDALQWLKKAVG